MPEQQRGRETYARLLDVAQDAFARQGYDATGVAEICRRAGVSKGAFYHHFAGKQALFIALLNRWLDRIDAQFASVQAASRDVTLNLRLMAEQMQGVLGEASGQLSLFIDFIDQARRDPAVWKAVVSPYRRYRDLFARMIAGDGVDGALGEVDPNLASTVLVSFAVGVLVQSVFDPDGADWGAVVRAGVQMLTRQGE